MLMGKTNQRVNPSEEDALNPPCLLDWGTALKEFVLILIVIKLCFLIIIFKIVSLILPSVHIHVILFLSGDLLITGIVQNLFDLIYSWNTVI